MLICENFVVRFILFPSNHSLNRKKHKSVNTLTARLSLSSGGGSAALAAPSKAAGSKASCLRTTTISLGDRAALQVPRHSSIALWQKEGSWSLGKKKSCPHSPTRCNPKGRHPQYVGHWVWDGQVHRSNTSSCLRFHRAGSQD